MDGYNISAKSSRNAALLLFLVGVFSRTQISIGGKIGIAELIMVACAPFVFVYSYRTLKYDKVLWFFYLVLLWIGGALYVDLSINNYLPFMMRGLAVPITVFGGAICLYGLLRKNPENLKWLLLGMAISGVVSVFIFQGGRAGDIATEEGVEAGVESVVNYKLFWVNQATTWLTLPLVAWYKKTPKWYMFAAMVVLIGFSLISGARSIFLVNVVSLALIAIGGKTRSSIAFSRRHYVAMAAIIVIAAVAANVIYRHAVVKGYMGDRELNKYEVQTAEGSGILHLLMSGRGEFFIGLIAALDKPLVGHGSVALDDGRYRSDFLKKYGSDEEIARTIRMLAKHSGELFHIPSHSHIICYWMWHGIFALIFWFSTIVLAVKTLMRRLHVIPGWYGYFSITIPMFFWDVFFSPFSRRVMYVTLFVAFLLVSKFAREEVKGIRPRFE